MPTKPSERRVLYLERKEKGLCPRCGSKRTKKSKYTFCDDCRLFFRNYQNEMSENLNKKRKKQYQLRKENNRCPRCGKSLGKRYNKINCPACLNKQYKYNTGGERPRYLK